METCRSPTTPWTVPFWSCQAPDAMSPGVSCLSFVSALRDASGEEDTAACHSFSRCRVMETISVGLLQSTSDCAASHRKESDIDPHTIKYRVQLSTCALRLPHYETFIFQYTFKGSGLTPTQLLHRYRY